MEGREVGVKKFTLSDWDYVPMRIGMRNGMRTVIGRDGHKVLGDSEIQVRLRNEVDLYPSDSAAADAFGVSRGHLSRVLRGLKPVDGAIAHALGYERRDCYVQYDYTRPRK